MGETRPARQICKGQVINSNERQTGIFFTTLSLLTLEPVLNMNDLLWSVLCPCRCGCSYLLVENTQMFRNPRIRSQTVLPRPYRISAGPFESPKAVFLKTESQQ